MATDYFHEKPSDVKVQRDLGLPGQVYGTIQGGARRDARNASGTLAHIVDLTPSSYSGSQTYAWTITRDGRASDYSHTTTSGATTAALAIAELVAYMLGVDGEALDYCYPIDNTTTLRLVAVDSGADSTFTVSGLTLLTQATYQTGSDASEIAFGRAVIRGSKPSTGSLFVGKQPTYTMANYMVLPSATTLPPITNTFVAAGTYSSGDIFQLNGTIVWGDSTITVALPFGIGQTAVDAAFAALVTDLNAAYGAYLTAAYTSGTNTLVITSDFPGMAMDFTITAPGSNTVTKTAANTDKVASDLFLGIVERSALNSPVTLGTFVDSVPANQSGRYVASGAILTTFVGTAPAMDGVVWLCTGSGSEGKLATAAAAGRIPLPRSQARWYAARPGQTVAAVHLGA